MALTVIVLTGGGMIGAVLAWLLTAARARRDAMALMAQAAREIKHWQDAAERAAIRADQAEREVAAWRDGQTQGRADVLGILPFLAGQPLRAIPPPAGGGEAGTPPG